MKVLGIVGPSRAEREAVVERLASRLGGHGEVATIGRRADPDPAVVRLEGVATAYALEEDGNWIASGDRRRLGDLLDDLAPDYDYVLLEGFPGANVPRVVLGDADHAGEKLVGADDADALDVDAVVEALRDVEPHVTLESLVARVKDAPGADRAGAIATFTGRVRARDAEDDAPTEYLEFEKYEGVAERRLETIREELTERDGVQEVLLHHRTGRIDDGEDIVFVVVLAGHREEAFRTVEDGINRLKDEVPIFKREVTVEEEYWVHEKD